MDIRDAGYEDGLLFLLTVFDQNHIGNGAGCPLL